MKLEEVFQKAEGGSLTYEQLKQLAPDAKFVDLSEGGYYAKAKHEDELAAKDKQIEQLNATIKTRDTDLSTLKTKLEEAGTDGEKLTALTSELDGLKSKYDTEVKSYREQLRKQSYEFAVKEYANTQKFTSQAAKRDFVQSMIAKDLKMEKDTILGADDFVKVYQEANSDAFVVEEPPATPPENGNPKPSFGQPTPPTPAPDQQDEFSKLFTFDGVR